MKYLSKITLHFARIKKNPLVVGSTWALSSRIVSIGVQFGYFVLLARSLGTEELGKFLAVASLTTMAFPLGHLGSSSMAIRDISRDSSNAKQALGTALFITLASSTSLSIVLFIISYKILPSSITPLSLILMFSTEILLFCISDCINSTLYALYQYKRASQNMLIGMVIKFLAAIIFVFAQPVHDMQTWTIFYFIATLLGLIMFDMSTVIKIVGLPQINIHYVRDYISQGIYFAIGGSAESINGSLDKTMMASLSTLEATGLYSAAWRFLDMASLPVHTITGVLYPKFFEEGASGIRGTFRFAQRIILITLLYGIISLVALVFLGPIIPRLLGDQYAGSVQVLMWLSPMILILSLQWIVADILAGSGHQRIRTIINLLVIIVTFLLNWYLIPIYSWKGAALSTIISGSFRAILLWGTVIFLYKKQVCHVEVLE
ncbi:MAG: oligosaccharide flippase family protein [Leptolyngbyaceae cyanobacterium]